MKEKSLKNCEKVFWDLIRAPEGVEEGLQAYPGIHLEEWFHGDEALPPVRRLDIYANMYFWRLHDAIKEDYPAVFNILGAERWNNLVTDYLLAYPSDTPFLQYAGRHLPCLLKEHALTKQWPYLPCLAALEWERAMIFEAAEGPTLSMEDLKKIPHEKWPHLKFQLVPAFKVVPLEWDISQKSPKKQKTSFKVWRHDFRVYDKKLKEGERDALQWILEKKPFGTLCEKLQSAERAAAFLAEWVETGLIAK